ncbi:hypothetical protein K469DRAFT_154099 [Zopfia rhizophila CBS 207.26]|uniref:Uncharacterized protein n=1 Tax=Zopfia rhizophila CBS 207.26 TaxID=1314779 RepID=A0A6A6E4P0_9PEZI|nr:hypothetical protein K469DRAFT_154099 [Zopfia rhizophila CBS 207.26]
MMSAPTSVACLAFTLGGHSTRPPLSTNSHTHASTPSLHIVIENPLRRISTSIHPVLGLRHNTTQPPTPCSRPHSGLATLAHTPHRHGDPTHPMRLDPMLGSLAAPSLTRATPLPLRA